MAAANSQPPRGGFLRTVRTVAWALMGVRGHKPAEHDGASPLSPLKMLITAVVFMLVFVLALVSVARYISGQ